jgi:hypothetical protein
MMDLKHLWILCSLLSHYLPHSETSFASVHSGSIFTRIGTLAHGLSYGHITIAIPLKSIEDRINQYENITTSRRNPNRYPKGNKARSTIWNFGLKNK